MKANFKTTVALATLLAGGASAAYATEGWYGRVDAGYSFDGNFDVEDQAAGWDWGEPSLENDWVESLGLGYAFSGGFRLEGEISHRFNQIEAWEPESGPPDFLETISGMDAGGDAHVWAAMLNAYFDLNRGGGVEPYVGLGIGAARANVNGADAVPPPTFSFDDQDTSLAYQGMVGLAFAVTDQLSLDVGYRYFAMPEVQFTSAQTGDHSADYNHQSATVGLRWQFAGAAPPPPPPPPPPVEAPPPPPPPPPPVACPAADFVVYFEWDRSNLNQAALETIDAAVARARACNLGAVTVVGHTDTSGAAQYNMGLSERRAGVVADALAARGIPATAINRNARGETELARATRDGVREPLNRRAAVTITFQ